MIDIRGVNVARSPNVNEGRSPRYINMKVAGISKARSPGSDKDLTQVAVRMTALYRLLEKMKLEYDSQTERLEKFDTFPRIELLLGKVSSFKMEGNQGVI